MRDGKKIKKFLPVIIIAIIIIVAIRIILGIAENEEAKTHVRNVKKHEFAIQSDNIDRYLHIKKIGDSNLFYLGLDRVLIDSIDLIEFLEDHDISELETYFNRVETYKDGGSKLYTCDDEKKCDEDIKILFCNTSSGDKDIYIANKLIDLSADRCTNE